jgi:transposase
MPGKISADTTLALKLVDSGKYSITEAAKKAGVEVSTVRRAMRRRGDEPRKAGVIGKGRPHEAAVPGGDQRGTGTV